MVTGTNASASGSVTPKVACPTVPTAPLARSARSSVSDSGGMLRVQYDKLPWGIWVLEKLNLCRFHRSNWLVWSHYLYCGEIVWGNPEMPHMVGGWTLIL